MRVEPGRCAAGLRLGRQDGARVGYQHLDQHLEPGHLATNTWSEVAKLEGHNEGVT